MTEEELSQLKYPIGKFKSPEIISTADLERWIDDIASLPDQMQRLTANLSADALNWRYRPEGWTIKQVVHHCVDSHINSYVRFKWTLTEDNPTIKAYIEERWAELPDAVDDDISGSLVLLDSLHARWVKMLKNIPPDKWLRTFHHPETGRDVSLDITLALYSWHSRHHLAHVKQALEAKGSYQ